MMIRIPLSVWCIVILIMNSWIVFPAGGIQSDTCGLPGEYCPIGKYFCKTEEIERFFDNAVPARLSAYHIPGAAVIVVKEGDVIFSKGYGYSDIGDEKPVFADNTVFRVGSVSKLFVWTAILQLAENGTVSLDGDVNSYLAVVQVPDTYPGNPVVLRDLFSHTAGFEEKSIGLLAQEESGLIPFDRYLQENIPKRVLPPGIISSYSNYGAALGGKVVEDVSGMPFEDYARIHIFEPLGMNDSSFAQPLPPQMIGRMATGYRFDNDCYLEGGFEYIQMAPSGGMSSTAKDMGRFMIMLLQNGTYENSQILDRHSVELIHSRSFTHDPRIPGWTYGFMERNSHGLRLLWHGGDTLYFHSVLVLVPELDTGIFVTYNGDRGSGAGISLVEQFLDRCHPSSYISCNETMPSTSEFEGYYISSRRAVTTIEKIVILSGASDLVITGRTGPDGKLELNGLQFDRIEDLVFCTPVSGKKAVYKRDDAGNAAWLYLEDHPESAYEKISLYESPPFQKMILMGCEGVFLSILLLWSGSILAGRKGMVFLIPRRKFGLLHLPFALLCGLNVVFILLLFWQLSQTALLYGIPPGLYAILVIPHLSMVLTVTGIIVAVYSLYDKRIGIRDRIEFLTISVAGIIFLLCLSFWNMIGWNF